MVAVWMPTHGRVAFYLADECLAAERFAAVRSEPGNPGATLTFHVDRSAFDALIRAGSVFGPIPQGAAGWIPGNQLFIPPTAFPIFDTLRGAGKIR